MKKLFVIALSCLLILSSLTPIALATTPSYNLTMQDSLTIEFEDHIPDDKGHLLLTSDDASGGAMMGGGWDTSGFSSVTIPFTVTEDGNYDVEFVESRGIAGDGFSRIDGSIFAEDNETLVHGFNMNFYPQKDPDFVEKEYQVTTTTGWSGGFGNTMIKQKYTNLALEAGTYNIRFDIHMVGDHTNFALDYFMLTPVAAEEEKSYELTMAGALNVEFEDHIPADKGHLLLTSADASGGAMMGGGWDTSGFSTITIPFTVTEAGNYDVEFVESRGIAGDGFSRIDGSIFAEDNETLVHGFNMNFYPQKDPDFVEKEYQVTTTTGWSGGFGNTMIKQKYTNLALEAGTYNIRFDIHAVGDHTNFALDYIKFTPVITTISAGGPTLIEFEDYVPSDKTANYVVASSDASGDKMVRSEWGETAFNNITIPVTIEASGYYNIEFVENKFEQGSFSRIDGCIKDENNTEILVGFNNNAYPLLDAEFGTPTYEGYSYPMIKQKFTQVYLSAGKVNISFDIGAVGDHTNFALDYIKFSSPDKVTVDGNNVTVSIIPNTSLFGHVILAFYDGDKLSYAEEFDIIDYDRFEHTLSVTEAFDKVRVFVWEYLESLVPRTPAREFNVTNK